MPRRNPRRRYASQRDKIKALMLSGDEYNFEQAVLLNETLNLIPPQEISDIQDILEYTKSHPWTLREHPEWLNLLGAYAWNYSDSPRAKKIASYLNRAVASLTKDVLKLLKKYDVESGDLYNQYWGFKNVNNFIDVAGLDGSPGQLFMSVFEPDEDFACVAEFHYVPPDSEKVEEWVATGPKKFTNNWKSDIDKRYKWLNYALSEMESIIQDVGPGGSLFAAAGR